MNNALERIERECQRAIDRDFELQHIRREFRSGKKRHASRTLEELQSESEITTHDTGHDPRNHMGRFLVPVRRVQ